MLDLNIEQAVKPLLVGVVEQAEGIEEAEGGLRSDLVLEGLEGGEGGLGDRGREGSGRGKESGENGELHYWGSGGGVSEGR